MEGMRWFLKGGSIAQESMENTSSTLGELRNTLRGKLSNRLLLSMSRILLRKASMS